MKDLPFVWKLHEISFWLSSPRRSLWMVALCVGLFTSSSAWSCLRGCWELLLFRRPGSAGVLNRTPWEKKYFHREQDYKISVPDDIMSHYWIIWWLRICQLSPRLGWIWNESLHLLRWRWIQAVAFSLEGPFKVYYTNSNLVSKTFRKKHVGWFWYTQKDGKN